jgi:hypothetical protein
MTFEEFVADWIKQVREYGSGVPQEAIDMAEQAWEIAASEEREACAKVCDEHSKSIGNRDDFTPCCDPIAWETGAISSIDTCAELSIAIRARSNTP